MCVETYTLSLDGWESAKPKQSASLMANGLEVRYLYLFNLFKCFDQASSITYYKLLYETSQVKAHRKM